MYDSNGICWHGSGRHECPIDHHKRPNPDKFFFYGRCKSGRRWFWTAYDFRTTVADVETDRADGWEDSEQAALDAARAAIVTIANGHKAAALFLPGVAYERLKDINTAKRAARPPSGRKHSQSVEYIYAWNCRYTILKKTAKRIYYSKHRERLDDHGEPTGEVELASRYHKETTGFKNRQKLEAGGYEYYFLSYQAYAAVWGRRDWNEVKPDLAKLKARMAAAHPDKGGSSAAFIEARRIYIEARRDVRAREKT